MERRSARCGRDGHALPLLVPLTSGPVLQSSPPDPLEASHDLSSLICDLKSLLAGHPIPIPIPIPFPSWGFAPPPPGAAATSAATAAAAQANSWHGHGNAWLPAKIVVLPVFNSPMAHDWGRGMYNPYGGAHYYPQIYAQPHYGHGQDAHDHWS